MIDLILISVGLIGLAVGSFTDFERREVPNWLNFGLIGAGLGVRAIGAVIDNNVMIFFAGLIGLAVMAILGEGLYYSRQWGGGDTKLLMGLGALFGSVAILPWFLFHFLINLVIVGAVYGILWSVYLAIRYHKHFVKELVKVVKVSKVQIEVFLGAAVLLIIASIAMGSSLYSWLFIILAGVAVLYVVLFVFVKTVESACMFRRIRVSNLTEGDWIAEDVFIKKQLVYSIKEPGISREQINRLKKSKIRRVMVKDGIPFVPSFFVAMILTVWLGNLLLLIIS